jgi:hypothetical protein
MTKRTCKKCGYAQNIRTDNRTQTRKFRCTSCGAWNKMKLVMASLAVIVALAMMPAYAYTEQIDLPRGDYLSEHCRISIFAFPQWIYTCDWVFEEKLGPLEKVPDDVPYIEFPIDPNSPNPSEDAKATLDDFIDTLLDRPQTPPAPPVEVPEELTPEEEKTIEILAECLRGFDRSHEWGAFVDTQVIPFYMDKNREQFAERDNLSKRLVEGTRLPLISVLKAIEECHAIQKYIDLHMIGPEEALKAVHDRMNVGPAGRDWNQLARGNEESRGFMDEKTADSTEIKAQAQIARDFTCMAENMAKKLCYPYHEFTGINRGVPDLGATKDVVVNVPNAQNEGKTAVDIYAEYNRLRSATNPNYSDEIMQAICDHYLGMYIHKIGTDELPSWLNHCKTGESD